MLYADTRIWLPDDLLLKADKMTMANAIELRVPFLDHRMVEYAATLPAASKLHKGTGKVLLRRDMTGDLPPAILNRPKEGFVLPANTWLRTELRSMVHDALLSRGSAVRDYMNMETVEKVVRQHEAGRFDRSQEIWTLLVFEFWHRVFMNRSIGNSGRLFGNVTPQEAL
jgi:asparagine synthase (glutamine-hydrolysing)